MTSFSPEQIQELKGLLAEQQQGFAKTFNDTLSGVVKRLTADEFPKLIDARLTPLLDKVSGINGFDEDKIGTTITSQLDAYLSKLAAEEGEDDKSSTAGRKSPSGKSANDIAALQKQVEEKDAAYKQQLAELQNQLKTALDAAHKEKEAREQVAEQARIQKLDDRLLDGLRGKVKAGTERELLTLLKSNKILQENEDRSDFVIETEGEYGLKTIKPATEVLDSVIQSRYSHYLDARPGTGTGASPAPVTSTLTRSGDYKYVRFQDGQAVVPDDVFNAAVAGGKLAELESEIKRASAA